MAASVGFAEVSGNRPAFPRLIAPPASSPAVRAVMQSNRASGTMPELALRSELHRRGLRYRVHHEPVSGLRCRADIVFSRPRIAVFVDGCFWHRCPLHGTSPQSNAPYWQVKLDRNVARDKRNDTALAAAGWIVVRVWEHEKVEDAADRIATLVTQVLARTAIDSTEH
jgi:DNA mismatch endonuclease (patch repair protein)